MIEDYIGKKVIVAARSKELVFFGTGKLEYNEALQVYVVTDLMGENCFGFIKELIKDTKMTEDGFRINLNI